MRVVLIRGRKSKLQLRKFPGPVLGVGSLLIPDQETIAATKSYIRCAVFLMGKFRDRSDGSDDCI